MKVFISAAEASSDTHAAEVLKRLIPLAEGRGLPLQVSGIGGPKLRAMGLVPLFPAESLLAMGFVEVITRLPKIYRYLDEVEAWAKREQPDVAVLCDYPEFHFKLAARLKKLGIRTICFIPPKVWVWRKKRIQRLAHLYDRVLSILPFEEKTYRGTAVNFQYVGNPLMDELPLALTREAARASFGLAPMDRMVCLMVGSRPAELRLHIEPVLRAAVEIARVNPAVQFFLPLPETVNLESFQHLWADAKAKVPNASHLCLTVSQGDAWSVLRASDAGIIKSGTSSLEAAILDCPHIVIYRAHAVSEWIFKNIIRYTNSISLTNLILGRSNSERVVPEFILKDFIPEKMAKAVLGLLEGREVTPMRASFEKIRVLLGGRSPSLRVAEVILEVAKR